MGDPRGEPTRFLADALREAAKIPGAHAVHVLGHYSGTVYLNDGWVTGAECAGTPDLRTRLIRSGFAEDHAGPSGKGSPGILREDLRKRMIDGSVNVDAIENLALSAILDAVYCLAHPTGATAPRLHIHRGQESTHGIDTHVSLDVVLAATDDIATRVRRLVAGPDAALTLRRLTRPGVVVDAGRWQVLARINGRQTPRDLAWATGAELFATLLTVDRLAVDGLCGVVPTQTSKPTPAPAPAPAPDGSNGPEDTETEGAGGTPAAVVAQRRAEASPAGVPRTVLAPPAEWADDLTADPTIDADLIQRLVTGLRALG